MTVVQVLCHARQKFETCQNFNEKPKKSEHATQDISQRTERARGMHEGDDCEHAWVGGSDEDENEQERHHPDVEPQEEPEVAQHHQHGPGYDLPGASRPDNHLGNRGQPLGDRADQVKGQGHLLLPAAVLFWLLESSLQSSQDDPHGVLGHDFFDRKALPDRRPQRYLRDIHPSFEAVRLLQSHLLPVLLPAGKPTRPKISPVDNPNEASAVGDEVRR